MTFQRGHFPVMADEMERYLLGGAASVGRASYCDCTAGAGGYARRILRGSRGCRLVAMDRDSRALAGCRERLREFAGRVTYFRGRFSRIREAAEDHLPLAGVVADLGLSRLQLDDGARGFSLRLNGPLDMRLDRRQELRADDLVNRGGEAELARLLYRLADERFSRRIAKAVVRARPIRDTRHLARVAESAVPHAARRRIHPATKTFLALRMAVNGELKELAALLEAVPALVAPGGRFVVVSFHSGEDRLVKRAFRRQAAAGFWKLLTRKVVRPTPQEVRRNAPSRSARMRAVGRTSQGGPNT